MKYKLSSLSLSVNEYFSWVILGELQLHCCMYRFISSIVFLRCDHYFCENCYKTSVAKKRKCPICAMPVTGSVRFAKGEYS